MSLEDFLIISPQVQQAASWLRMTKRALSAREIYEQRVSWVVGQCNCSREDAILTLEQHGICAPKDKP
jgi:hypothetical protein